jgi:hypothetical protein
MATTPEVEGTPEGTPPAAGEGETIDGGDRLMGYEMEDGTEGGVMIEASISDISTTNPILSGDTASAAFLAMTFEALCQANPDTRGISEEPHWLRRLP